MWDNSIKTLQEILVLYNFFSYIIHSVTIFFRNFEFNCALSKIKRWRWTWDFWTCQTYLTCKKLFYDKHIVIARKAISFYFISNKNNRNAEIANSASDQKSREKANGELRLWSFSICTWILSSRFERKPYIVMLPSAPFRKSNENTDNKTA